MSYSYTYTNPVANVPAPTATLSFDSSSLILCPAANQTLYTSNNDTSKHWLVICGRDYSSDGGAVDIAPANCETFEPCIALCARTPDCNAATWGNYFGVNTCFMKKSIGKPGYTVNWYAAVLDNGAYVGGQDGLSDGAKAGVAVGSVVVGIALGATAFALWWFRRRTSGRRRKVPPGGDPHGSAFSLSRRTTDRKPPATTGSASNPSAGGTTAYFGLGSAASDSGHHPLYSSTSREALTPGETAPGVGGGYSETPMTPMTPSPAPHEKEAGDFDWRHKRSELPTHDGGRYGPEYELESRPARAIFGGGPGAAAAARRDAAEQKFLASDMATMLLRKETLPSDKPVGSPAEYNPPRHQFERPESMLGSGTGQFMYMPPPSGMSSDDRTESRPASQEGRLTREESQSQPPNGGQAHDRREDAEHR